MLEKRNKLEDSAATKETEKKTEGKPPSPVQFVGSRRPALIKRSLSDEKTYETVEQRRARREQNKSLRDGVAKKQASGKLRCMAKDKNELGVKVKQEILDLNEASKQMEGPQKAAAEAQVAAKVKQAYSDSQKASGNKTEMDLEKQENANKLRRVRVTNAFTNIKAKYPLDDARQRVIHMFYFKDGTAVRFKLGVLSAIAPNLKRANIEFMDKNCVYIPLKGVAPIISMEN